MAVISYFWRGICFAAHVCLQRKDQHIKNFFSMLHHEESPKQLQYNMEPPFLEKVPHLLLSTLILS